MQYKQARLSFIHYIRALVVLRCSHFINNIVLCYCYTIESCNNSKDNFLSRSESGVPLPGYGQNAYGYGQPEGSYRQEGYWSYTDGYGNPIKVTFVADQNGYQPSSDILPTPVPTEYPTPAVDPTYVEPQPDYQPAQPAYEPARPAYQPVQADYQISQPVYQPAYN